MSLHVDYLISGAGAMGMAFADVILHESDKTIALVDRRAAPGGHWNDAYPLFDCINQAHFTALIRAHSATTLSTKLAGTKAFMNWPLKVRFALTMTASCANSFYPVAAFTTFLTARLMLRAK